MLCWIKSRVERSLAFLWPPTNEATSSPPAAKEARPDEDGHIRADIIRICNAFYDKRIEEQEALVELEPLCAKLSQVCFDELYIVLSALLDQNILWAQCAAELLRQCFIMSGPKGHAGRIAFFLGLIHSLCRDAEPALTFYQEALRLLLCESTEPVNEATRQVIQRTYENLGKTHLDRNEPEAALKAFTKALLWARQAGDSRAVVNCYQDIGATHRQRGHLSKALDCFLKAQDLVKEMDDGSEWVRLQSVLVSACIELGEYEHVGPHVEALEDWLRRAGDTDPLTIQVLGCLASVYLEFGQFERALKRAQAGLGLSRRFLRAKDEAFFHRLQDNIFAVQQT